MTFSTRTATIFFATSLFAWGIIHFIAGDFIAGRPQAWPGGVGGKMIWAYVSAVVLILASISILTNQKARLLTLIAGLMILLWAAIPNLYVVISTLDYGGLMTNTGKSITIGFGALLVASVFQDNNKSWTDPILKHSKLLASIATGLFFIAGGIQHFIFIDFVTTLVPRWIPGDVFWSYLAGVGLIASGVALVTGILRKLAALIASWMVFTWFIVLHIPRGFGEGANVNEWIAIFEALAVAGVLVVIYKGEVAGSAFITEGRGDNSRRHTEF
jgi:uncharacterized membrane protein